MSRVPRSLLGWIGLLLAIQSALVILKPVPVISQELGQRPATIPSIEMQTGWTFVFPILPPRFEGEIAWIEDGRDDPQKLAPFVSDPTPSLRARTAIALGRIGSPGSLSLLRILLEDKDPRVRGAAAFGMGEMMEAQDEMGPALRSHILPWDELDPAVRALSVEALAKLGIRDEPDLLLKTLLDPDRGVVETALLSLWRLSPDGMAEKALELSRHANPRVRWKAAYALMRLSGAPPSGRTPVPGAEPLPEDLLGKIRNRFVELLDDSVTVVRLQAVRGLGGTTGDGLIERILEHEGDPDSRVRIEVARSMGRLEASSDAFDNLLRDPVDPVRLEAVRAMASCRDPDSAYQRIRELRAADEPWIREVALTTSANLLGMEGMADSTMDRRRELLAEALLDEWRVRAEAVRLASSLDPGGHLLRGILDAETGAEDWFAKEDPRVLKYAVSPLLRHTAAENPSMAPGEPLRQKVDSWRRHPDEILRAMTLDFLTEFASEIKGPPAEEPSSEEPSSEEASSEEEADEQADPALDEAAEAPSPIQDEADRAEWFGHFHDVLKEAMSDSSTDVRTTIVDGLARLAPLEKPQLDLLHEALSDPGYLVRSRAAEILREEGQDGAPGRAEGMTIEELKQTMLEARKIREAQITTSKGVLKVRFFPDEAPLTVANFVRLAREGYYDDKAWHRVVPDFVVQDGCPRGDGWGGPGYTIRCEINSLRYVTGAMGMALSGKDTGGSQYFITHSPQPHLDGGYTVFGHLREGWDVLQKLAPGDRILEVTVSGGS